MPLDSSFRLHFVCAFLLFFGWNSEKDWNQFFVHRRQFSVYEFLSFMSLLTLLIVFHNSHLIFLFISVALNTKQSETRKEILSKYLIWMLLCCKSNELVFIVCCGKHSKCTIILLSIWKTHTHTERWGAKRIQVFELHTNLIRILFTNLVRKALHTCRAHSGNALPSSGCRHWHVEADTDEVLLSYTELNRYYRAQICCTAKCSLRYVIIFCITLCWMQRRQRRDEATAATTI